MACGRWAEAVTARMGKARGTRVGTVWLFVMDVVIIMFEVLGTCYGVGLECHGALCLHCDCHR